MHEVRPVGGGAERHRASKEETSAFADAGDVQLPSQRVQDSPGSAATVAMEERQVLERQLLEQRVAMLESQMRQMETKFKLHGDYAAHMRAHTLKLVDMDVDLKLKKQASEVETWKRW